MQSFDFRMYASIATANGPPEAQPMKTQPEAEHDPKQHLRLRWFSQGFGSCSTPGWFVFRCIENVTPATHVQMVPVLCQILKDF